jgi:biopolymer transport protein ExbB/biopolymer transport protein TolQ
MFERWIYFRRRGDDLLKLRADVRKKLDADDIEGVDQVLAKSRAVEARVAREAWRWLPAGAEAMGDAVESELALVKRELERGTNLLGTLGNNAPFVGLFGTVLGVIIAFHALGQAGGNAGQMGGVMAGIAEALVATGVGLFVAIPAVIAYNVLQKRIGDVESGALSLTKLLTAYVKSVRVPDEVEPAERQSAEHAVTNGAASEAADEATESAVPAREVSAGVS